MNYKISLTKIMTDDIPFLDREHTFSSFLVKLLNISFFICLDRNN